MKVVSLYKPQDSLAGDPLSMRLWQSNANYEEHHKTVKEKEGRTGK